MVLRERRPNKVFVDIGGNRELPALVALLPALGEAGAPQLATAAVPARRAVWHAYRSCSTSGHHFRPTLAVPGWG